MPSFIESIFQSAKKIASEPRAETRDDLMYRVRWVLGQETSDEPHCEACRLYAGEYENYQAMLERTEGCVPGFFEGWADPDDEAYEVNPGDFKGVACGALCRCHLEMEVNGKWFRV